MDRIRQMSNIKFIYFDIGEVFIKGAHSKDIAAFLGVSYEIFRPVFKKYQQAALTGEITAEEFLEHLKKELHLNQTLIEYPKLWVKSLNPIQEMHTFIREISKTRRIGFLTNLFTDLFDELKKNNLVPDIPGSVLVGSWEVGLTKPDKAIYLLAQKKAGVAPGEILFVDDNQENVAVIKKLGWQGIVFNPDNPEKSITQIKNLL